VKRLRRIISAFHNISSCVFLKRVYARLTPAREGIIRMLP
jgi:hypothetical protein